MRSRGLLAVAQRRIEDQYSIGVFGIDHVVLSLLELGCFSGLVWRLRAAAGALFPPKGEEKQSKVEAERHHRTE